MAIRTLVDDIDQLISIYRDGLLEDIIPFWVDHSVDKQFGGYLTSLDRDGSVIDMDKSIWLQGRFVWMLSTLYNTVEPRDEWLDVAKQGIDFLDAHGFDADGRMFFTVTRDGRPLRKRRYVFSEMFTIIAFAEYAKAANEPSYLQRAQELMELAIHYMETPGLLEPKTNPEVRPMKGMSAPMILITTAQVLRGAGGDADYCNEIIQRSISEIERDFIKPDFKAVMETVGPEGETLDCYEGRTLTPGHAIEAAWFIMDEAITQDHSPRLIKIGTDMLDWMFKFGWDEEYGGMLYFRDVVGRPVQEYWHDMKFWWPHNETIIASLLAYHLTGERKFAEMHHKVHEWAFRHFPDPEYGEWFGYLHRDGRLSVPTKGNLWKGGFHVPRMYWKCWQICEAIKAAKSEG